MSDETQAPERPARRRRKRLPIGEIVLLCLILPALYVGIQLYRVTRVTYEYETAVPYTMSDSIEADGVVLFDETPVEGSGDLGFLVSDGERVSAGTQVAEVYTDPSQAGVRTQLDSLDSQIALLQKSQNTSTTQVDVLLSQRSTSVYDLLESIDRASLTDVADMREQYLLAQNKLQITTGQVTSFAGLIDTLTSQRDTLAAQLDGLSGVTAPANGYFVSSTSAGLLNAAKADVLALSPADFSNFLTQGAEKDMTGLAGKIVSSYTWQFCGICTLDQSAKFDGVTSVQLSFPGKAETKLPAQVISVTKDEEAGIAEFVLQCEYVGADVLKLGQETAQIDFASYTGLRVSTDAVHLVLQSSVPQESPAAQSDSAASASGAGSAAAPSAAAESGASASAGASGAASSSAGEETSDYVSGVYVKYGNLARFRRITKLYEDPKTGYILVALDGALGTDNEVRMYDEIIVSGMDLYDGKLL